MGRKSNKSTVERLPKGERTPPISKVILLPQTPPSSALQPPVRPVPRKFPPSGISFVDDHALATVLNYAGPMSILSALQVSSQWRRVAKSVLHHFRRIDLGALYRTSKGRATPPTYVSVVSTLHKFPKLTVLTMHNWPYMDIMHDVAAFVASYFKSNQLREIEISTLPISAMNIVRVLERCPNIRTLRMAGHDCISDSFVSHIAGFCARSMARSGKNRLDAFHITRSRTISGEGVRELLVKPVALNVLITKCSSVDTVSWVFRSQYPLNQLSLTGCTNLRTVLAIRNAAVLPNSYDPIDINLSHCTRLRDIRFVRARNDQMNYPLRLQKLNLSGCRSLQYFRSSMTDPPSLSFPNLEELSLFGVRCLNSSTFETAINFSGMEAAMPKLRRLDLNGTTIDALKLIGYEHLLSVDCSGCATLNTLHIENCWSLQRIVVKGRRAPLQDVKLVLSTMCVVDRKRPNWHWETTQSKQMIFYP